MPPRPDSPYTPIPSVLPEVQQPNDQIRAQATPLDFGAQVGQAAEGLGKTVEQGAQQIQGMLNESLATQAETNYQAKLSEIVGKYKSMEGYDAVQARDSTINDITNLRQQVMQGLPTGGAALAFSKLALRHEAYALQDTNIYAASQVKAFDLTTAHDSAVNAVNATSNLSVAQDDARFGQHLQDVQFQVQRMLQNRGYSGLMTPNADGSVSFDETTDAGRGAKAAYEQQMDQYTGQAWQNRIKVLADDPGQGSVKNAQAVFDAHRSEIPAQAQLEISAMLQPRVKQEEASGAAGTALNDAETGYQNYVKGAVQAVKPTGAAITPDQIDGAIHGQESGGAANAPTSVAGAVGGHQIEPATFAQYAHPGEVITSAADNQTVGKRIVADLAQKYNNDPARVAVGYFSGPGNVAPPSSPTPWIQDRADATGKTTSSYVSDVMGRLGGVGGIQTKADYYKANYADIVEQTRQHALAAHPDDTTFADAAVARTEQQLSATIRQQDLAYASDRDKVWQAANGDLSKGTAPLTVDQLRATSPDAAAAWDRLTAQQPEVAHEIATKILTENARAGGTDARTYGPEFYSVFNRVHAPAGSPNQITDPSQVYNLVGNGLTMSGLEKIRSEIAGKNTPDGEAEAHMRAEFFKNAHAELTMTNDGLNIRDPKGEELFLRFMPGAYAAIDAAKAAGKTPAQIYNPDSPDYVGKTIAGMRRSAAQTQADVANANSDLSAFGIAPPAAGPQAPDLTTTAGVIAAYKAIKAPTREDYYAASARIRELTASQAPEPVRQHHTALPLAPTE